MKTKTKPVNLSIENEMILKKIENRQQSLNSLSKYLSELESQLALIFAASPDIIVFLDEESRILKISDAAFTILGYTRADLVGKILWDFIDPEDAAETKARFAELKEKKILYFDGHKALVNHWITKKGSKVKLMWRFSLCDERENQTVGVASDLTQFGTNNVYSYKLLQKAVESSTDGIVIIDAQHPDNAMVYANKAFEKITGYASEELVGNSGKMLLTEEAKNSRAFKTLRKCIEEGKNCDVLLQSEKKSGEIFYGRLAISAVVEQDTVVNFIGVVRDITDKMDVKYEWSPNAESGFIHLSKIS